VVWLAPPGPGPAPDPDRAPRRVGRDPPLRV